MTLQFFFPLSHMILEQNSSTSDGSLVTEMSSSLPARTASKNKESKTLLPAVGDLNDMFLVYELLRN